MSPEELAHRLGLPETTRLRGDAWKVLVNQGVIVELRIGRTRGQRKLTREDLGLEEDIADEESEAVEQEFLRLGSKSLLPRWVLRRGQAIEAKARLALERASFPTAWGRFVPATAFQRWWKRNQELEREYLTFAQEVGNEYEQIRCQVREAYAVAARRMRARLKKLNPRRKRGPEWIFVDSFVGRIDAVFPTREELMDSFVYEEVLYYVPTLFPVCAEPEEIQALQLSDARRQALEEMRRQVARQFAQEKERLIEGFLRDVVSQLRGMVYDACAETLRQIRKNGFVPASSVRRLRNLVERVRELNFVDEELEQGMQRIKELLQLDSAEKVPMLA